MKYKYEIALDVYSQDALKIAKSVIDKNNDIEISIKNGYVQVIFDEKNKELFYAFMNEALAQQCRIDTSNKNSKVAEMLTTLVIVCALGKGDKR